MSCVRTSTQSTVLVGRKEAIVLQGALGKLIPSAASEEAVCEKQYALYNSLL